jgi:hypothetical protein
MKKRTNFHTTIQNTLIICLLTILVAFSVQYYGASVVDGCSYLDPVWVDFLAFGVGLFLIIDGFHRIWEHKNDKYRRQFTRSIRIAIGCAIVTIHIMQFIYK